VKKNKVAPPFRVAEFDIMFDEGISKAGDLLDIAVELDVIEKRGSYYYREGESLAQGRENAKQFLREHPDVAAEVEATVRDHLALGGAPLLPAAPEDKDEEMPEEEEMSEAGAEELPLEF
jgi:recombination protein RecA